MTINWFMLIPIAIAAFLTVIVYKAWGFEVAVLFNLTGLMVEAGAIRSKIR